MTLLPVHALDVAAVRRRHPVLAIAKLEAILAYPSQLAMAFGFVGVAGTGAAIRAGDERRTPGDCCRRGAANGSGRRRLVIGEGSPQRGRWSQSRATEHGAVVW